MRREKGCGRLMAGFIRAGVYSISWTIRVSVGAESMEIGSGTKMNSKTIAIGSSFHNECIAKYWVGGRFIFVYKCWSGDNPKDDEDLFYDLYDDDGTCLNLGEPWMDDGAGPPNFKDISLSFG